VRTSDHIAEERILKKAALFVLAVVVMAGCKPQRGPTPEEVGSTKLVIKGSNTFGEELAPRLIEGFRQKYPNVSVELESRGTATGFAALLNGEADIAAASRPPSDDEMRLAKSLGFELDRHVTGFYGVAVIVNPENRVHGLSSRQLRDVFNGTIKNWKELGGADMPIQLCIRDAAAGTHLGFREIALQGDEYGAGATAFKDDQTLLESVRKEPNAIGYVSMSAAEQPGVTAVTINGVTPTALAVNEGQYPLARTLTLCTIKGREPPAATAFIRFVQSSAGQKILSEAGFVRRVEQRLFSLSRGERAVAVASVPAA
jgi:phosphate transport system substrate-binding protein